MLRGGGERGEQQGLSSLSLGGWVGAVCKQPGIGKWEQLLGGWRGSLGNLGTWLAQPYHSVNLGDHYLFSLVSYVWP